jgi:hypothetical protein
MGTNTPRAMEIASGGGSSGGVETTPIAGKSGAEIAASGGQEPSQIGANSIADLLKLYHVGPEVWSLDWMAVRDGANIQPYGYDRNYNDYSYGNGGGNATQQYQQGYMNFRVATG